MDLGAENVRMLGIGNYDFSVGSAVGGIMLAAGEVDLLCWGEDTFGDVRALVVLEVCQISRDRLEDSWVPAGLSCDVAARDWYKKFLIAICSKSQCEAAEAD
jgi:hypothetical protein